jgi:penicillin-binding protein 1B
MTDLEPPVELELPPAETPVSPERPGSRAFRPAIISAACLFAAGFIVFITYYVKYARVIERRLSAGPFSQTLNIYTAPRTVNAGDTLTLQDVINSLRQSGYTTSRANTMGWYHVRGDALEIFPGRNSYSGGEPGVIEFARGKVSRIVSLSDNTERQSFALEPQLITNLSAEREKRRLVHFTDIPPSLVHAVVSTEDKHFFQHSGFDVLRIFKAAYVDLKDGRKAQGASTLTMQLARGFWLEQDKSWKRKMQELLITMHLEHRLSKQQIFEYYANQVYLGRNGSFSINGFGEAAHAFFGKDLSQISVPEAALLAGLIQRPSYYNPYRYPDRARERRNIVLALMRQNGYLTEQQYRDDYQAPLSIAAQQRESQENQFFVDLMENELSGKLGEHDKQARYVFTTLDPDLQHAAEEAVAAGMQNVDRQLRKKKGKGAQSIPAGQPQVALIALDPHTGAIKAMVGGRNYGASQLNHVLAMRQPGSVFKPFVYGAALESAIQGGSTIFTPASMLSDEPSSFTFGKAVYQPGNFKHEFMGDVTLRTALAHSLNVATVELAQQVGYSRVVALARRAGLNDGIQATPSVALGAYETTPLEMAGAYTVFANQGVRAAPTTLTLARAHDGRVLYQQDSDVRTVLDARVNYLLVNMMQEVLRSGTAAGARAHGFTLPAAGKTGTTRDGWFAGFTSRLLCVVWVGFDDNRDLKLEGSRSALPIWTEFMKRAAKIRQYRDAKPFAMPSGVVSVKICPESGKLASPYCPEPRSEVFIDGTQPVVECDIHALSTPWYTNPLVEELNTIADR